jgi:hypothetical protein
MAVLYRETEESPRPPLPVVMWRNVFALVDQGSASAADYPILERMVCEQGKRHPEGLGCLVIIPPLANPPPENVRRAIRDVLTNLAPQLRGLCWLVEGTGFRAAAVRATLVGLRVFNRQPYPTCVASDMTESLQWLLACLSKGSPTKNEVRIAFEAIQRAISGQHAGPGSGSGPVMTSHP